MSPEQSEAIERWYDELYRLMWAMVWDVANADRFYLEPDDIFADLSEELCQVVIRYFGKPDDEMKSLLIVSLRNRCKDLQVMEYYTHRDMTANAASLEADMPDFEGVRLEDKLARPGAEDAHFDLEGFLDTLEDDEYLLVMEVLEPSQRFFEQLALTMVRRDAASTTGDWVVRPSTRLYMRALGWSRKRLLAAWSGVVEGLSDWLAV